MTSVNPDLQLNHTPGHVKHDGHNMTGFRDLPLLRERDLPGLSRRLRGAQAHGPQWLPDGVAGLEVRMPLINTVVLVSSSFMAYFAERYLHQRNLWGFRAVWLLTMAMGSYFVYGQYVEWSELTFSLGSGVFGGMFYLLTGFHGLHVITGILLMGLMLARSFRPGNYDKGEMGVASVSLFWHFVDVIWIILFLLIYVWQ